MDNQYFDVINPAFEDSFHTNGQIFWYASDFVKALGYKDYSPQMTPISKAMSVCLGLPTIIMAEHFREDIRQIDGRQMKDFKMTRFACYLVAMNSDVKKEAVAKAQAYFAAFATHIQEYIKSQSDIERVPLRKELSEHERSLSSTAKKHGIEQYAFFNNKGYMGLYNMPIHKLREIKDIPYRESPLNYMGAEELGANIFRITQTDAKIKRENLHGQRELESAAFDVGKAVRKAIAETGGTMPEILPKEVHIKNITDDLKKQAKPLAKKIKIKLKKSPSRCEILPTSY